MTTLNERFAEALANAQKALEAGDLENGKKYRAEAETLKAALTELDAIEGLRPAKAAPVRPPLPMQADAEPAPAAPLTKAAPLYTLRFGDESATQKTVMTDLVGADYQNFIWGQSKAFAKYLRGGEAALDRDDVKALKTQVFPWQQIETLLREGMSVAEVKTTMVEAQGTLGGYAVPPAVQADIISRLPGQTVVRGSGATVVNLTAGNSIDVPKWTGGDARYASALRGVWGAETTTPTAKNATLGMTPVIAHVYTYKVPMSQTLVEDAANLVSLVQSAIGQTLAIDEDEAFLIGDGTNRPEGILPNSANGNSLTLVNSGHATLLTADGLIGLSDALDVQYDGGAIYVFAKATGTAIRKLKNGDGEYLFDRDLQNGLRTLLGSGFKRSEAMPAIGASAYPIIRGDFSGYWIVQKAGLTISRFQDSYTGVNVVEYHVRRRVGGRCVEPWKFAAQCVSA